MDKYLSQTGLEKIYKNRIKGSSIKNIDEVKKNNKLKEHNQSVTNIFLCHSHLDKTIVDKMLILFDQLNVLAYVDWMDNTLPAATSHITAALIKDKIEKCDKFIFLATYRALSSKWCNWELGLAFSLKTEKDFAILPIASKSENWPGNEYLGLYPIMRLNSETEPQLIKPQDITVSLADKCIALNEWLQT